MLGDSQPLQVGVRVDIAVMVVASAEDVPVVQPVRHHQIGD
jgi:hypothetical protein